MHWCFLFVLAGVRAIRSRLSHIVVLFVDGEHALSVSPITRPSTAGLFTPLHPSSFFTDLGYGDLSFTGTFHRNTKPG